MPDKPNIVFFHMDNLGIRAVREFEGSAAREQAIPAGSPPPFVPGTGGGACV